MAYKALYRTYRPTCFEEVAGQKHIVKTLKNAVLHDKIAHAYLFCGPRGTGKTSIAKIFAKLINCEQSKEKPCGVCSNCLAIQQGNHPDIIEIDAASNNGVDEVRELIEKVKYAPMRGKYKVYIIDEVHMMSTGAFNALLKTIEEPPAHVIFIFATTEPHKVLPTILSRCQRYDFTKVGLQDMVELVQRVLDNEKITYEEEAIKLICQLADGGIRDALSITDQVIAYAQDHIQVEHVNDIYGIITTNEKIELLQMIGKKEVSELLTKISQLNNQGIDLKRTTLDLIDILKETIIHDYTKDINLLQICDENQIHLAKMGKTTQVRLKMIDILIDAYDKYRFSNSVSSYFEVSLLKMINEEEQVILYEPQIEKKEKPRFTFEEENKIERNKKEEVKPIKIEEEKITPIVERPIIKEKVYHGLENDYVLRLLVGANKENKADDMQKLKYLSDYYMNQHWAKHANLLRDSKLVASSDKYIVVTVANQAIANEINEQDSNNAFSEFMEVLLHKPKKVFAVTLEQQNAVIQEFVRLQKIGQLPKPISFDEEVNPVELITDLFGKENVTITED